MPRVNGTNSTAAAAAAVAADELGHVGDGVNAMLQCTVQTAVTKCIV